MNAMYITIAVGGLVVLLLIWGVATYNKLIQLKNRYVNAFAQIDVQLQRRYDLIPNLIETAKGYMQYEKETLTQVVQARSDALKAEQKALQNPGEAKTMADLAKAEGVLSGRMTGFLALAENYPDLKANQTMQQLMEELSTTENKIAFARQAFNDAVMTFNTYRDQFPAVIVSNMFGYVLATFFEVEDEKVKENIKVSFS